MNAPWPGAAVGDLVKDAWLTAALARHCFRLNLARPLSVDDAAMPTDLGSPLFIDTRLPVDRPDLCAGVEDLGFRLVDTSITLARPVRCGEAVPPAGTVRFAEAADRAEIEAIARSSFRYSRFHLDPRIPDAAADHVKALWAGNFFDGGRGDHMVVAIADRTVAGFVALLDSGDGELVIDLIAVAPAHQGAGLARAMIAFAEANCGRPRALRVGTQLANLPSLRLYLGDGFQLTEARYVFHLHG